MPKLFRKKHSWWRRLFSHYLKNHLVPHKGNHHLPHLLHHHKLVGLSMLLVAVKVLALAAPAMIPFGATYSSAITPSNIISLTNATREANGLETLSTNELLSTAASMKARDMLANQYFSHTSPAGVTPVVWIDKVGYSYQVVGENLAVHFSESEDVQAGWMASATHRANILDRRFTEIGVGVAQGTFEDVESIFVVQMFGTPRQLATQPAVLVGTGEVAQQEDQPQIDLPRAKIVPSGTGYEVEVPVQNATSVSILVGEQSVPLVRKTGDVWEGEIPVEVLGNEQKELVVVTSEDFKEEVVQPVALLSQHEEVKGFYHFADPKMEQSAFLFSADSVNDLVGRVYFYLLLLLGAVIFLSVVVKWEVQHHKILAHGLLVMILIAALTML